MLVAQASAHNGADRRSAAMIRVVRSIEELARLPRDRGVNGLGSRAAVELAISGLPLHARLRAERHLNALQRRCGCVSGSIATLASLVFGIAFLGRGETAWLSFVMLEQLALLVALSLIAGLGVKVATLIVTRWQFSWACERQTRLLGALIDNRNRRDLEGDDHVRMHALGR